MANLIPDKYLFVYFPHTGSRSVKSAVHRTKGTVDCAPHHVTVEGISKQYRTGNEKVVSIYRDHHDLMVSWYYLHKHQWDKNKKTFYDFLQNFKSYPYVLPDKMYSYHNSVDIWMEFSQLESDLNIILKHAGLPECELPHIGPTPKKPENFYWDDDALIIMENRFGDEIRTFEMLCMQQDWRDTLSIDQ